MVNSHICAPTQEQVAFIRLNTFVQLREFTEPDLEHVQQKALPKKVKQFKMGIQKMFLHEAHLG